MTQRSICVATASAWLFAVACVGSDDAGTGAATETGSDETGDTGSGAPEVPTGLALVTKAIKQFEFTWAPTPGAEHYQILARRSPAEPFVQVGEDVDGPTTTLTRPLHLSAETSFRLRACNAFGCTDAEDVLPVEGPLVEAIGYVKRPTSGANQLFGWRLDLSADGHTLAVGVYSDGGVQQLGVVELFELDPGTSEWIASASVVAPNSGVNDSFGAAVALDAAGDTLAIGAHSEAGGVPGIGGDPTDNSAPLSGAVYLYDRDPQTRQWLAPTYIKAPYIDPEQGAGFGYRVALSADGDTLAVAAIFEASASAGIDGDPTDASLPNAGAVFVYQRDPDTGDWLPPTYIKASNPGWNDVFGGAISLSGDGLTLAVGAHGERSNATHIGGDQSDDSLTHAGAVYVYERDSPTSEWTGPIYIKASNTEETDRFGEGVSLTHDGNVLVVGAPGESSASTGIDGLQFNDSTGSEDSGAVYVYLRDPSTHEWMGPTTYLKGSIAARGDGFGDPVRISSDGTILAVAAIGDDGNAPGVAGQTSGELSSSGGVYVFRRDPETETWTGPVRVKAANPGVDNLFGVSLGLSGDGSTLGVGAYGESTKASGVGGIPSGSSPSSGAVYLY